MQRNYKEKICLECGEKFKSNSNRQKYCLECKETVHKQKKQDYDQKRYNIIKSNKKEIKKLCPICNKEFKKEYNNQIYCSKECKEIAIKKRDKKYREKYKEKRKIQWQNWYQKNKEVIKEKHKEYIKNHRKIHKDKYKEYQKKYYINNKTKINNYVKNRLKKDVNFKIITWCRKQVRRCLNYKKDKHTFDILGYTPNKLKQRLEFQFKNGMTWENYGTYWEIHHKKELDKFNFTLSNNKVDYHKMNLANCLANLQPVTKEEHKKLTKEYMKNKVLT